MGISKSPARPSTAASASVDPMPTAKQRLSKSAAKKPTAATLEPVLQAATSNSPVVVEVKK